MLARAWSARLLGGRARDFCLVFSLVFSLVLSLVFRLVFNLGRGGFGFWFAVAQASAESAQQLGDPGGIGGPQIVGGGEQRLDGGFEKRKIQLAGGRGEHGADTVESDNALKIV